MNRFVLDASVVMTWCFPDESSQKAVEVSERIAGGARILVPAFWPHEVLSALLVGEKRNRLTPELTDAFLADLIRLPVDLDPPAAAAVFENTQALCRKHGLTPYDAAYLEIALRSGCALATLDADLHRAALSENVSVI